MRLLSSCLAPSFLRQSSSQSAVCLSSPRLSSCCAGPSSRTANNGSHFMTHYARWNGNSVVRRQARPSDAESSRRLSSRRELQLIECTQADLAASCHPQWTCDHRLRLQAIIGIDYCCHTTKICLHPGCG